MCFLVGRGKVSGQGAETSAVVRRHRFCNLISFSNFSATLTKILIYWRFIYIVKKANYLPSYYKLEQTGKYFK